VSNLWLSRPDSGIPEVEYWTVFCKNWKWMAVEIFDKRQVKYTSKETDVWAFGIVALVSILNFYDEIILPNRG